MTRINQIALRKQFLLFIIIGSFFPLLLFWHLPPIKGDLEFVLPIYLTAIASLIGLFGAVLLMWQYLLGFRLFAGYFTDDFVWVNNIHKQFGIWGFLFIALHPIIMLFGYGQFWFNLIFPPVFTPREIFISLGKVAFFLLTIIWITSALFRKRLPFRFWKMLHLLNYPILPLVLIHAFNVGATVGFSLLKYYWLFLGALHFILLITRLLFQAGIFKQKYKVRDVKKVTNEVVTIQLEPMERRIEIYPGQYIYIQTARWGESHPFTVAHRDPDSGIITIAPKAIGKFTTMIQNIQPHSTVFIDGAYGIFTANSYDKNNPVVFIAGGIGITPFLTAIASLKQDVYLFYSNKTKADIAFIDEVEKAGKRKNIHIIHTLTRETVNKSGFESGRISADLIEKYIGKDFSHFSFYICGPSEFMGGMKTLLKGKNVKKQEVFSEEFAI